MRTLSTALPRYTAILAAAEPWHEEGNGLGFSIGGFHPFRVHDWKDTVKKIDSNITRTLRIDRMPILGDFHRAVTGAVDRMDASVAKDFQKTKKWSQAHRKELQIAAALAAMAVGGYFAFTAIGTGGTAAGAAAGAGAAGAETAGVSTSAFLSAGSIEALPATSTVVSTSLLAPTVVSGGTAAATAAASAAAVAATTTGTAATGTSLLSTVGSALGTVAKEAVPLLALGKALGVVPQAQPQSQAVDYGGGFYGGGPTYGGGGGGGGSLGPATITTDQGPATPAQATSGEIPGWAWIVGGGVLLWLITE